MRAYGGNQMFLLSRPMGGLFLISEYFGFQVSHGFRGSELPKGRYMKSDLVDFIADSSMTPHGSATGNFCATREGVKG